MTNKEAYTDFASIYDELMTDIPYDHYVDLLSLATEGLKGKKIIDVGCGTGILSVKLAKAGAFVTGIDLSKSMLHIAEKRANDLSLQIEFLEKPMQKIEGTEQFDAAVIAIDSLNYLPDRESILNTFVGIHSVLKSGGVLMFDVHSTFKTNVIFMEGPFTFDNDRIAYIWHTEEGDREHSVLSELSFFVKEESGLYRRFDERHEQRTYEIHEYVELLREAGFTIERIFADWEDEPPHEESERIFFQVRK
ncbi:class I SAM-dependent methyltransferase [Sporosarcina sp. ACRSL]|uniref:class I SAM-dependent methyltransferase n=1 Tax=Sporosarcina sp. ACRSL TaxID=2918215 RepID=UPI001EF56DD3|nr:class I SAM-dependent methyltransferase [Sporosarcina sp. ACRSL]MCG7345072.1 class I SAM-dependent methyltransferase [Sporosarcina sp. ACRSL]